LVFQIKEDFEHDHAFNIQKMLLGLSLSYKQRPNNIFMK